MCNSTGRRVDRAADEKLDGYRELAALAAAVAQRGAAAPGGFAGEKPVLPLAAHLLWLILAFHKFK